MFIKKITGSIKSLLNIIFKNVRDDDSRDDEPNLVIFNLEENQASPEEFEKRIEEVLGVDTENDYFYAKQKSINQILKNSEYYQKNEPFFEELSEGEQEAAFRRIRLHSRQWVLQHKGFNFVEYLSDPQTKWLAKDWRWSEESFWYFDHYSIPATALDDYIAELYFRGDTIRLKDACYLLSNQDPAVFENMQGQMSQTQVQEFQAVRDNLLSIISTTMDVDQSQALLESQINFIDLGHALLLSDIKIKSWLRSKLCELIQNELLEMKRFLAREIVVSRNLMAYKKIDSIEQAEIEKHLLILLSLQIKQEEPRLSRRKVSSEVVTFLKDNFSLQCLEDNMRGRLETFDKLKDKKGERLNLFSHTKSFNEMILTRLIYVLEENYPRSQYEVENGISLKITHKPFAPLMPESA